jgi:hypothetical protein
MINQAFKVLERKFNQFFVGVRRLESHPLRIEDLGIRPVFCDKQFTNMLLIHGHLLRVKINTNKETLSYERKEVCLEGANLAIGPHQRLRREEERD